MISGETRGSGFPTAGNRGQGAAAAATAVDVEPGALAHVWGHPLGVHSGGLRHTNLDFGGETRFHNQQGAAMDAIKG